MKMLFVDDHTLLRQSLGALIEAAEPGAQIDGAGDAAEALRLLGERAYDLVLTDLSLGEGDGVEVIDAARRREPPVPCLVLSMHADLEHLQLALRHGAVGYVTKSSSSSELLAAIRAALRGERCFDQAMLSVLARSAVGMTEVREDPKARAYGLLTEREQEVFLLLARDAKIEDIAARLCISAKTVENHRTSIYAKLGISDRFSCYRYARELGLAD